MFVVSLTSTETAWLYVLACPCSVAEHLTDKKNEGVTTTIK